MRNFLDNLKVGGFLFLIKTKEETYPLFMAMTIQTFLNVNAFTRCCEDIKELCEEIFGEDIEIEDMPVGDFLHYPFFRDYNLSRGEIYCLFKENYHDKLGRVRKEMFRRHLVNLKMGKRYIWV